MGSGHIQNQGDPPSPETGQQIQFLTSSMNMGGAVIPPIIDRVTGGEKPRMETVVAVGWYSRESEVLSLLMPATESEFRPSPRLINTF